MSFKQSLSVSFISHQIDSNETSGQSKNSTNTDLCQICGDKATVISEMNMNACRCYAACRLAKCFSMGMRSDLIRKEVRLNTKMFINKKKTLILINLWFIYLLCIKNY
jgi:hypothetical protein